MRRLGYLILTIFSLSLTVPSTAYAYLDPGSGSMLLQRVLGGLAGLAVIAKLYWHRLLGLFGMNAQPDESDAETSCQADLAADALNLVRLHRSPPLHGK